MFKYLLIAGFICRAFAHEGHDFTKEYDPSSYVMIDTENLGGLRMENLNREKMEIEIASHYYPAIKTLNDSRKSSFLVSKELRAINPDNLRTWTQISLYLQTHKFSQVRTGTKFAGYFSFAGSIGLYIYAPTYTFMPVGALGVACIFFGISYYYKNLELSHIPTLRRCSKS